MKELLDLQHVARCGVRTRFENDLREVRYFVFDSFHGLDYHVHLVLLSEVKKSQTKAHHAGVVCVEFNGLAFHQSLEDDHSDLFITRSDVNQAEGNRSQGNFLHVFQLVSLGLDDGRQILLHILAVGTREGKTEPCVHSAPHRLFVLVGGREKSKVSKKYQDRKSEFRKEYQYPKTELSQKISVRNINTVRTSSVRNISTVRGFQ
jgi:hypothetical protein